MNEEIAHLLMKRRFVFITLIFLILNLHIFRASAQSIVVLSELQISFWPEYDRNAMLVIYRGTLASNVPIPASITLTIPSQYGPPAAVAYEDAQGRLLNVEYTTTLSNEELTLAFNVPSSKFQFEYYDASLVTSSSARHYGFNIVAAYPIQALILQVQQPAGASGLVATPGMSEWNVGEDGLTYGRTSYKDVKAGEAITFDLSYVKNDEALSVNNPQPIATPQPALSTPVATAQSADSVPVVAIILGLAGVALVGAGVWWYGRARRQATRSALVKPLQQQRAPAEQPAIFCHQCGQRAEGEDVFCRNCGARLRR